MKDVRSFFARLKNLFHRNSVDRDMAEQIERHLELMTEENVMLGMSPAEARLAARKKFGGVEQIKEQARDERGFLWLEQFWQDLGYAFRALRRNPTFASVAILSIALGIGPNVIVFSLVNAVLLERLPVRDPQELVLFNWIAEKDSYPKATSGWVENDPVSGKQTSTSFSIPTFAAFQFHHETLASVFAFAPVRNLNLNINGQAEIIPDAQLVSGDYYAGLGVQPAIGRLLTASDDQPGADPAAVISDRYWQRRFGGDVSVIGQKIFIHNSPFTIVGVTAPEFQGTLGPGQTIDVTLPLAFHGAAGVSPEQGSSAEFWWVRVMGRLKAGATLAQARDELAGAFQGTIQDAIVHPKPAAAAGETYLHLRADSGAKGLGEARRGYEKSLGILAGLVGLVLLVACSNVANLLLARGAARHREIALRLSLGASRSRIVRQLLLESLLLGFLGAAVGVAVSHWGRDLLMALQPLGRGRLIFNPALDRVVLLFATAVALATAMAFGLAPALRASRINLSAEFQGGAQTLGLGSRSRLARSLMTLQVALSFILLVGAGLFLRTLRNLEHVDVGFARDHLLVFGIDAPGSGKNAAQSADLYDRFAARFAAVPGVTHVSFATMPLLSDTSWTSGLNLRNAEGVLRMEQTRVNRIGTDFLATIQLPVVAGRTFTPHDNEHAPKVIVINQALARACFGEANPIGRRVSLFPSQELDLEVVGVVRNAQYSNVRYAPPATFYLPYRQAPNAASVSFFVRFESDPSVVLPGLRVAAHEVAPDIPLSDVRTQEEQIDRLFTQQRLFANLCSFFSLLALGLAAVGLYGLMSYVVIRRTGEIGLRMALGARAFDVQSMIVRESLWIVATGLLIGVAGALVANRAVASFLFGLAPTDLMSFVTAAVVLVFVTLVAAWLPANRASRVNPLTALRSQ